MNLKPYARQIRTQKHNVIKSKYLDLDLFFVSEKIYTLKEVLRKC